MTRLSITALILLALLAVAAGAVALRQSPAPTIRAIALDGYPGAMAVDTHSGHAFITTSNSGAGGRNGVAVLDSGAGRIAHTTALAAFPAAVAVDERTGRAFVASFAGGGGGRIDMLDANNGRVLRDIVLHRDASGTPDAMVGGVAVDAASGRVFVTGYLPANDLQGIVDVLDARSGRLLRTVGVGQRPQMLAVSARTGRVFVADTASSGVSVLDARTGAVLRAVPLGAAPTALAVADQAARVFVTTGAAPGGEAAAPGTTGVRILDATTGVSLRTIPMQGAPGAVVADPFSGHVFVGNTATGTVSMLDARTGARLHTTAVGQSPVLLAADERNGRVLVATRDTSTEVPTTTGTVRLLDGRTGAVLRTLLTRAAPVAMAVDAQAGRAIVANYGGSVRAPDTWDWIPAGVRQRLPFLPSPPSPRAVPGSVSMLPLA